MEYEFYYFEDYKDCIGVLFFIGTSNQRYGGGTGGREGDTTGFGKWGCPVRIGGYETEKCP